MLNFWPFKREKTEQRSAMAAGYTAEFIGLRQAYISGRSGLGELCGVVQAAISLWEQCFAMADIDGSDLLTRHVMAMVARGLGLRGESVWLVRDDGVIPASDWQVMTRRGRPVGYRLSLPESGGAFAEMALAAEVLHFRIGVDASAPWAGQAPLRRARLTAELLHGVESALQEIYEFAPLGSQIVPMPEQPEQDNVALGRSFRGQRGRVLLRESVNVTAAGGPGPNVDWRPAPLSPDLSKSLTRETLEAARNSIALCYGILPSMLSPDLTGPQTRECQRHLVTFVLQPLLGLVAEEAASKLGGEIKIDLQNPSQAFDSSGRARSFSTLIEGLAAAKAAGISEDQVTAALKLLNWSQAE
jgi:hypothetical protein